MYSCVFFGISHLFDKIFDRLWQCCMKCHMHSWVQAKKNTNTSYTSTHHITFISSAQQYHRSRRTPCSLEKAQQQPRRPPYLQVPTIGGKQGLSYDSYHSTRRERRRWEEDEGGGRRWEPLPCKAAAPLSHARVWSSAPPGRSTQCERESDICLFTWGGRFTKRKREMKQEKCQKLQTRRPSHLPFCNPSTARAPHKVTHGKTASGLHVSITISSSTVLLFVSGLDHSFTHT